MERLARMWIVAFLLHAMLIVAAAAQTPVGIDDRVRVYDARGRRLAQGPVRSVDTDSIVVGDPAVTLATESFRSGGYRMSRRTGTQALEMAVGVGLVSAGLLGSFAYCFQIFGEGCAEDMGAAIEGAAIGFAVGGAVGGLIGAVIPEYEDVDVGPYGARVAAIVEPRVSGEGSLGMALSLRLVGRGP